MASKQQTTICHDVEIHVEFDFTPGRPARGPSCYSGGEPADPPETEVTSFYLTLSADDEPLSISVSDLTPSARARFVRWLEAHHSDDMLADVDEGPDPDEAYERARDDRMEAW